MSEEEERGEREREGEGERERERERKRKRRKRKKEIEKGFSKVKNVTHSKPLSVNKGVISKDKPAYHHDHWGHD